MVMLYLYLGTVVFLTYTALGSAGVAKEMIDIYSDGRVLQIEDFREFRAFGCKAKPVSGPDKGHAAELAAFHRAVRGGAPWPIALDAQLQAMDIAFRVEEQLQAAPGGAEKHADLPP